LLAPKSGSAAGAAAAALVFAQFYDAGTGQQVAMTMNPTSSRWDALDVLRGLTIMLMLLNLSPGSWEFNYSWLTHAKWDGWTLIDIVAPAFLFCIGVALPLSLRRRSEKGATRQALLSHVLWRSLALIAIGFFLNLYPHFDFAHVRIPGVLQRIGLCYGLVGSFMLLTARVSTGGSLTLRTGLLAGTAVFVLVSYWMLLYFVPAPEFAAPHFRFDPVGSWPSVIDRAVIGVDHFFPYWPVDGKVVFDPEGILSTWPACFNVLLGALVGIVHARGSLSRPAVMTMAAGALMMLLAVQAQGFCPIIKNIWTSTFALFSGGFCMVALGILMPLSQAPVISPVLMPSRIFGENPLLAYILVFLIAPLIDYNAFGTASAPSSLRSAGQAWFSQFLEPRAASLAFGLCGLAVLFVVLMVCHRKRWILKL
jgi:predicted acyltransferase